MPRFVRLFKYIISLIRTRILKLFIKYLKIIRRLTGRRLQAIPDLDSNSAKFEGVFQNVKVLSLPEVLFFGSEILRPINRLEALEAYHLPVWSLMENECYEL